MKSHRLHTMLLAAFCGGCATQPAPQPRQPSPAIVVPVPVAADEHEPAVVPDEPAEVAIDAGRYLDVVQGERVIRVATGGSAAIRRQPFALRFALKPYSDDSQLGMRLVAHAEPKTSWPAVGAAFSHGPPFGAGFGMAAAADGYESLFIQPDAFHYLMYEPGAAEHRVRVIDDLPDGRFLVETRIPAWTVRDGATAPTNVIHFAALFDDDDDQMVDEGELVVFDIYLTD